MTHLINNNIYNMLRSSRSLKNDDKCKHLDDLNKTFITDDGIYNIHLNTNVTVSADGITNLYYNHTSDDGLCNNLIDMTDINGAQTIVVHGFSDPLGTNSVGITIALLIGVAAFGIYGPSGLLIVPVLFAADSTTPVATQIIFDNGTQSIILNNVSSSSLTKDNFIFADEPNAKNNNNNDDTLTFDIALGIGIGLGVPLVGITAWGIYKYLAGNDPADNAV